MKIFKNHLIILLVGLTVLAGCSTQQSYQKSDLNLSSSFILLPIINLSQAPMAEEKTEQILMTYLRSNGVENITEYEKESSVVNAGFYHNQKRYNKALIWAKEQGATYWVTGSVDEWRYKSGLDGEPAVGLTLKIIDSLTGKVVWTASGAKAGWGRESVSATMHTLISDLVSDIN